MSSIPKVIMKSSKKDAASGWLVTNRIPVSEVEPVRTIWACRIPNFFFSEKKKFDQKEKKRNLFLILSKPSTPFMKIWKFTNESMMYPLKHSMNYTPVAKNLKMKLGCLIGPIGLAHISFGSDVKSNIEVLFRLYRPKHNLWSV
jgi:hypothetical protein